MVQQENNSFQIVNKRVQKLFEQAFKITIKEVKRYFESKKFKDSFYKEFLPYFEDYISDCEPDDEPFSHEDYFCEIMQWYIGDNLPFIWEEFVSHFDALYDQYSSISSPDGLSIYYNNLEENLIIEFQERIRKDLQKYIKKYEKIIKKKQKEE